MKLINVFLLLSTLLSILFTSYGLAQIPHNSRRFVIDEYYYPDQNGYTRYQAHGFAQQTTSQNQGRLFFLPILSRSTVDIEFIDEYGIDFNPFNSNEKIARSIRIPVNIEAKLPNETQLPAIAAALESGIEENVYLLPVAMGPNNSFLIYPPARSAGLVPMLMESSRVYKERVENQRELAKQYSKYKSELVNITELEVSIVVDNEVIANRRFDNSFISTNGVLTHIEVVDPTLYQQNRIARNRYDLLVSYKFRDAKTSTIDARFDAKQIINRFLEETQQSMRSSSSSGWQFLGFGSRRKTVKSSMNSTVRNNYNGQSYQSTSIEMFDASDNMIEEFERDFFPTLSKDKVINNHLKAAETAAAQGNEKLKQIHLDYAASLKNSDPDLEVDMAAAVASLSAGDYAGFIANGVRWGSHRTAGNNSFRRVVVSNTEIEQKVNWTQMRTVSVQHSLTENVKEIDTDEHYPFIGLCGANQYNYPVFNQTPFGVQQSLHEGLIISCVQENGPLRKAGVIPGMIVSSIGGSVVTNTSELENALEYYHPGDEITVTVMEYQGMNSYEKDYFVELVAGAPKNK